MKAKRRLSQCGFTLIEMLVVVGIIVLLAAIVLVNARDWLIHGRQMGTQGQIDALKLELSNYKTDLGSYPPRDRMIEALKEGLGGNIRWNGPYYSFEQGRIGQTGPTGRLQNPRNSPLTFYGGGTPGDAEQALLPANAQVYLDQFNRPIVYIPNRDYDTIGTLVRNETGFYNPTSFQLFSFGFDGKSDQANPGYLLYADGIDNDGDTLIDRADNPKTSTKDGKVVEDDLANW